MMLESEIKRTLGAYAKTLGWKCYRLTGGDGEPDRMYLRTPTQVVFVEYKTINKRGRKTKPTAQQLLRHKELKEMRFTVVVIHSVDEGIRFFNKLG